LSILHLSHGWAQKLGDEGIVLVVLIGAGEFTAEVGSTRRLNWWLLLELSSLVVQVNS
jgi:hypothetical protein